MIQDGPHDGVLPDLIDRFCDLFRKDEAGGTLYSVVDDLVGVWLMVAKRVSKCGIGMRQRK
jgi:hypothetical protein